MLWRNVVDIEVRFFETHAVKSLLLLLKLRSWFSKPILKLLIRELKIE